ncbi:D-TA family PLP-dependent enzyme [Pedobacter sp. Du54]|uniref:D-TA family PLP-dependent enzyme n=1 Tax=Pedobacter anseongensis TaxID=3133439 RepID=UPI0030A3A775
MNDKNNWYTVENEENSDSPALLFYLDRITHNVKLAISLVGDVTRFRPHVKTHKTKEIVLELMANGVTKFKCATIAEAEMLAQCKAPDVLLAYPLTLPKLRRFIALQNHYPDTLFSCLFDHKETADLLSKLALEENNVVRAYLDLNVGMNRTGITADDKAIALFEYANQLPKLEIRGLHAYDGHITQKGAQERKKQCDLAFEAVMKMRKELQVKGYANLLLIAGGSPTFLCHLDRENTECSSGTFVFWDKSYADNVPEQPFECAALILTRIVSLPAENKLTIDLGHKAIASEGALKDRAFFLNAPELIPISHSEEHMVVEAPTGHSYKIGDALYVLPFHVCPTVALYREANCIVNGKFVDTWKIVARDRTINF